MFPFVLPMLALGALAAAARGTTRRRPHARPADALLAGDGAGALTAHARRPNATQLAEAPESAIVALGRFLQQGAVPPSQVVAAAIGEAESMGRHDLVEDLVRAFVLPVVLEAERRGFSMPGPARSPAAPSASSDPAASAASVTSRAAAPSPSEAPPYSQAELEAEAERVLQDIANADERAATVELVPRPEPQPQPETITVSGKSSPIEGIGTPAWAAFVTRVSRELPTFSSTSHVGQFRQHRRRLRELDIDASSLVGAPEAQQDAFRAEMRDAYKHARASGMLSHHVGRTVDVPVEGDVRREPVTLSGVLGVIQAAGLEGGAQWLEQPEDRERFANTTAAFLRTNGVF